MWLRSPWVRNAFRGKLVTSPGLQPEQLVPPCGEREREREQIAKSCIVLNIVLDGQGESGEISRWNRIHGVGRMDIDPGIDIKFAPKYLGGG